MARVKPAKIEIVGTDEAHWSTDDVEKYEFTDADQTSFINAQFVLRDMIVLASTRGFIDIQAEQKRLAKLAEAAEKERRGLEGRLSNPSFAERAKPEAVDKARSDLAEKSAEAERYRAALERLG